MAQKKEINTPVSGMKKTSALQNVRPEEYANAKNVNFQNENGEEGVLKTEASNLLASKFKEGFVVIGFKNDITTDNTYFFLNNPDTGVSEFGKISYNQNVPDLSDIDNTLSEPLEDRVQEPSQTYQTLLADGCNKCLNLSKDHPIKEGNIVIKNEKCGNILYFTDNYNSPRYIELDNLERYTRTGDNNCGDDNTEPTCLDCDKLRIFKLFKQARITPEETVLGGRLRKGTYEFIMAYSDQQGNEMSEYFSLTNPVSIFDVNDNIIEQQDLNETTNFAIKLKVSELDKNFGYYKVAVIQNTAMDGATRYFEEGVHPITDNSVLYSGGQGKKETTINKLFIDKPDIVRLEGISKVADSLIGYGTEVEKEINLQPVVNLMGGFLKWQTHMTTEDYYENGINTSLGKGYYRDESYPFSIRFTRTVGQPTAIFPLICRPPESTDLQTVNNKDTESIYNSNNTCNSSIRDKRFHFYNTAKVEGKCSTEDSVTYTQQTQLEEIVTIIPSQRDPNPYQGDRIPSIITGTISVRETDTDDFIDLKTFIEDKRITCGSDQSDIALICPKLDPNNYLEYNNPPELEEGCTDLQNTFNDIEIVGITNESYNFITKKLENYNRIRPLQSCNIYDTREGAEKEDQDFSAQFALNYDNAVQNNISLEGSLTRRINTTYADRCSAALDLQHVTPQTIKLNVVQPVVHPYHGALMASGSTDLERAANITTSKNALYVDTYNSSQIGGRGGGIMFNQLAGGFVSRIHEGALWFRINVKDKEKVILEISRLLDPSKAAWRQSGNFRMYRNRFIRVHIFPDCFSNDPIETTTYEDENEQLVTKDLGGIYELNSAPDLIAIGKDAIDRSLDREFLYLAVDIPIAEAKGLGPNNYPEDEPAPDIVDTLVTLPLNSCFTINTREEEFGEIEVFYESIELEKIQKWSTLCTYQVPVIDKCSLIPNEFGKFAYMESTETYPDNQELFDSSGLEIVPSDFEDNDLSDYFSDMYSEGVSSGKYILNEGTNFSCKPIRHFKFPDNKVSPFYYTIRQSGFTPSIIYPMGVTIDQRVIINFLDIAVKNGLITQEQRDTIDGYEIFRGDRTLSKSIEAKGILFDTYQYEEDTKKVTYSNYPYNDLGDDQLNYDISRNRLIEHPYDSDGNNSFTFHSPVTDYLRPTIPSEMKVEGYMFGNSRGQFDEVEDHSKWVILGDKARRLASKLATAEVVAEAAINIAQSAEVYRIQFGLANSLNPVGIFLNISVIVLSVISATAFKYGRYKYEWLQNFTNLGQPENFAYYYSSEGYYNYFKAIQEEGDSLRSINLGAYLKDGRKILVDKVSGNKIHVNNYKREESLFLTVGEEYNIEYPEQYTSYDNSNINRSSGSRTFLSNGLNVSSGRSEEIIKNVASPYASLKNYVPDQYGTIDSIKWITTSFTGDLTKPASDCLPIFGGDIFISRHTVKRKIPMFIRDAFDVAPLTPFNYSKYANIGSTRFYCDYKISDEVNIDRGFPEIRSDYNFDSANGTGGFYVSPPNKFYLYYYGIPNFLVETEINTNYRYGKKQPEENFYPNVGDYMDWTQQNNVPISERNRFFYNFDYSRNTTPSLLRTLPSTFNKEDYDCRYDEPNGGIQSLVDSSENDLSDPWLVFRPLDRFNFSSSYGKLKEIREIESQQVLIRFEDTTIVHNAVDYTTDDGTRPETEVLGNGGLFARRPRIFNNTDLGKWGTHSTDMSSNEFGHFFCDTKRGSVIQVLPSSQSIKEISKYGRGNRDNGMFSWFKEHLPFKILKSGITGADSINVDNPYNGIGISMGYDDRYKRVFLTKKDYIPKVGGIVHQNGTFSHNEQEVELNDTNYFEEVSFTIAYNPLSESWVSFYDFKPNYYIAHNDYFQTGINNGNEEFGLWSHNLTNKSYRVFYGKKYNSSVTFATKSDLQGNNLNNIQFKSDAKRYHNEYDFAYDRSITWDKASIWNAREHSGDLVLVPQTNVYQLSQYPVTNSITEQEILVTNTNELWSFDHIYNRSLSENDNRPLIIKDINDIEHRPNPLSVSFYGKPLLEYMSGTSFNVKLEYTGDTRYEVDLQWTINTEQV